MKMKKIISTLLAVVMLMSALVVVVGAEEETKEYTYHTNSTTSLMKPNAAAKNDETLDKYNYKSGEYEVDGVTYTIKTPEDKLALMDYRYGTDRFELYVDAFSGEVALRNKLTGEILFSNPYDVGSSKATATIKNDLLSQIVVNYTDVASGTSGIYYSYTWAANREQIIVKNIKGGIRVEYTIGRVESRSLLPRMIEVSAMEEIFASIQKNMEDAISSGKISEKDAADERHRFTQFQSYYGSPMSLENAVSEEMRQDMLREYPVLERCNIYVLDDSEIGETTIKKLENLIKQYCPEYTFEDLDEDHQYVEYEGSIESSPLFKMALEYTLDENGLVVRLPANGIRFNETLYRLDSIEILPYMGSGKNPNSGYTFFPDGSGTLFDFEDIAILGTRQLISGKVYGQDYAYHEISGMYEEIIRYPVFGVAETVTLPEGTEDANGTQDRGFVAIVEEGDSLMEISSYHAGQTSEYNTVKMSVFPRPTDTYNVADAISVGSNSEWTVVSARKYTGNYKIRYMMLTDDELAAKNNITDYNECSYVGMAKAYRSYLEKIGTLTRLTSATVEENIPLYIETFGAIETTEKFLSIPFNVMSPLTSFQDIKTMYDELRNEGRITNINFIMTGYTDGGMTTPSVPYNLKWEKSVAKEMKFEELLAYAKQEGFGLFPDFDFVFSSGNTLFDGLSLKDHAVKTIDNRYTSKREYSATKHTYVSYFELALSPAYFSHFYEKFIPKYQETAPTGISVSTLGSYLNSDFDEDEPYNRADGQAYTIEAFKYLNETMANAEIMTSGGNAYTWQYVDHITDIALDSSRFSISSASVPFLGIVLHGYVEIAGTPINMEGNLDYAFLKSLESGAAMKFILSYQKENLAHLKEYETLSQYYSVRYDIWKSDVISMYEELNELLKGVQTSPIVEHQFLDGVRVPDDDELEADALAAIQNQIQKELAEKKADSEAISKAVLNAKLAVENGIALVTNAANSNVAGTLAYKMANLVKLNDELTTIIAAADAAQQAYKTAQVAHAEAKKIDSNAPAVTDPTTGTRALRDQAKAAAQEAVTAVVEHLPKVYAAATDVQDGLTAVKKAYTAALEGMALLESEQAFTAELRAQLSAQLGQEFENAYAAVIAADIAAEATAVAKNAYTSAMALKNKIVENETPVPDETEYHISDISKLLVAEKYTYTAKVEVPGSENGGVGAGTVAPVNNTKYVSDKNMIVYEVYENGTSFLLNFNDYRVVVEVGDRQYSLDAYGYLVLTRANAQ